MRAMVPTLAVGCALCATPALAIEGTLIAAPDDEVVHIWTDERALKSAQDLILIGIPDDNPEMLTNLAACTVEPDTRAITRRIDYAITEIRVIDGPESGCTGVVPNEHFKAR